MKPKETNTAPITPTAAHRSLVTTIVNYDHEAGALLPWDDCAQFIADSEARALAEIRANFAKLTITSAQLADNNVGLRQERDQLRAERDWLKTWQDQAETNYVIGEPLAKKLRDTEAERDQLRGALALGQQNCDDAYDDLRAERDAARAEVEQWELAFQEQYARAEKAEAELREWHLLRLWGTTPEIVHDFIKGQQSRIHAAQDAEAELAKEREKVRALRDALTEIMENSSGWAESTAREALESADDAT